MSDEVDVTLPPNPEAEQFYEGAYVRIILTMAVLAGICTIAAWIRFDWRVAAGFLLGCGLAAVNFLWLKRAITTLAGKLVDPKNEPGEKPRGHAAKFVLRYLLIGAVGYVIFKSSVVSLSGLLVGLFLPVAAILVEAVYETYAALRRGL